MSLSGSVRKIRETDEELSTLIPYLSPVILAASAVHMSGRMDIIRSSRRPQRPMFSGDLSGALAAEEATQIRRQALWVIKNWRDGGCNEAYRPSDAEFQEMLNFVTGVDLPPGYLPLIREDMTLDNTDPRAFKWATAVSRERKSRYPVIIIGAGMSGILMGLRLRQAELPFVILEKAAAVGGTWYNNRYPGLRVDVPSHAYSYSFVKGQDWSHLYAYREELETYFSKCCGDFGVSDHIRFGAEVVRADWIETERHWQVRVRASDGTEEKLKARALISAAGFFREPSIPQIEGAKCFAGAQFHAGRWRSDVELSGKRVGVVGNAATALQMIPPLAEIVDRLTVFQRSPSWTLVNPDYTRKLHPAERWATSHLPGYEDWMRTTVFNWPGDLGPEVMMIDPQWPQDGRATSPFNDFARQRAVASYQLHLADRPDLLEKLLPDYPLFTKRPTISDGFYFEALKRENVSLVTKSISRLTPTGIIDDGGGSHELDVIIYATGYKVQEFLSPMAIIGRGGIELHAYWNDRPGGYLGIVVPKFPNFFLMYGPGTNLGYNGNLIFNSELQATYIASCLRLLVEEDREVLEVREAVFEEYMERTGRELEKFVWSAPYGTTYFRNSTGRVTTNTPWSLLNMWTWTRNADPADFLVEVGRELRPHQARGAGRSVEDRSADPNNWRAAVR